MIIQTAGLVFASFPSPADDFFEGPIDLKTELIPNPDASFLVKVSGNSMQAAAIDDGDVLIIDRSVQPTSGCVAVCFLNGGFTVKRLQIKGKSVRLLPSNPAFPAIDLVEGDELTVWGVVTYIIKKPV
ncbi:MAG: translesion error-prone DNA polymerase V autoproteolytic subunit [Saprospiraceae bacterium]